jgi:hypothetical protein
MNRRKQMPESVPVPSNPDIAHVEAPSESADMVLKAAEKVIVMYTPVVPRQEDFGSQLEADKAVGIETPMEIKLPK